MTAKCYEVLFKSDGAWRRWSFHRNLAAAEKSLARLDTAMGEDLVRFGFTRIREYEARKGIEA